MAFSTTAHSCDFCRKFMLYKTDPTWWDDRIYQLLREQDPPPNNIDIHLLPKLIIKVRRLMNRHVPRPELEVLPLRVWRRLWLLSRNYSPLQLGTVLSGLVILDCTMREFKDSAPGSCPLYAAFIEIQESSGCFSDDNLLVADIRSEDVHFGYIYLPAPKVLELDEERRSWPKEFSWHPVTQFFDIVSSYESAAAAEISTRTLNICPSSIQTQKMVSKWLETCIEEHDSCVKAKSTFMPTRLIEILYIGKRRAIRLSNTDSGTIEPYVALSYCWGGDQQLKTTRATFNRHRSRINMSDLPATIRDAILTTESLGIKKLWVDSFCIIQDDPEDIAWEINQMPLIYSKATVTIAASRASGVEEGFLHDRVRLIEDNPQMSFELPYRCSDGQNSKVQLIQTTEHTPEPLDSRAWALQERFLAPRLLEYGSHQTRWFCQKFDSLRTPVDGYKSPSINNMGRCDDVFTKGLRMLAGVTNSFSDPRENWYRLVEIYSHRNLMFGTDKLPAIGGIAAHFKEILHDKYMAGLWKCTLLQEILWKAVHQYEIPSRPKQYQAPSWSWACINRPIEFQSGRWDEMAKIVDCQVTATALNKNASVYDASFGAITSGRLTIAGGLRESFMSSTLRKHLGNYRIYSFTKEDPSSGTQTDIPLNFWPDALEAEVGGETYEPLSVFLLPILHGIPDVREISHKLYRGLVLRRHDDGLYSRLGVFELINQGVGYDHHVKWLSSALRKNIIIV